MKQITDLINTKKVEVALALSISFVEPKRTLALNLLLMHCTNEGELKLSEKIAEYLGRNLNVLEYKIIVKRLRADGHIDKFKEVALKLSEPDRTELLNTAFYIYANRYLDNRWDSEENRMLDTANLMTEPKRTQALSYLLSRYLRETYYFDRCEAVVTALGRKLSADELNNFYKSAFKSLRERSTYQDYFKMCLEIMKLMNATDYEKCLEQLLHYCLANKQIERIIKLSAILKEPRRTASLNIVLDHYLVSGDQNKAIKITDLMSEPQRTIILNSLLDNYVAAGDLPLALAVAALLGKSLDDNQIRRILDKMIDDKKLDGALEKVEMVKEKYHQSQLLKKIFAGFIELGWFEKAYNVVRVMHNNDDKTAAAKTIFELVFERENWLEMTKQSAELMAEPDKAVALKKSYERCLLKGRERTIVLFFKDRAMENGEFNQMLKRINSQSLRPLYVSEIKEMKAILNAKQIEILLKTLTNKAIKNNDLGYLKTVAPHLSFADKIKAFEKLAKLYIDKGLLGKAREVLRETNEKPNPSDLAIILKKSIKEGWYEQAQEVAKLLGTEISKDDLRIILNKCLKECSKKVVNENWIRDAETVAKLLLK